MMATCNGGGVVDDVGVSMNGSQHLKVTGKDITMALAMKMNAGSRAFQYS
jgi:hypothetical protein